MNFLQVYNIKDLQSLPSGTWGIKEPTVDFKDGTRMDGEYFVHMIYTCMLWAHRLEVLDERCEDLDLILVPGPPTDESLKVLTMNYVADLCRSCV